MGRPPRIHVLPAELASQIAAGEVVERPASVVKELVENALDAGARRVDVEIEGGGRGLVRVADDGLGMTPEEAALAFERHATSKLRSAEDLFALGTMGFRGEALPSIAAVSTVTVTTREAEADQGYRLAVGGAGAPVGAARGTVVEVRDLFARVPARLKFLKAEATEAAHVTDVVTRLALAHPRVHFTLKSGGRAVADWPPHPDLVERAKAVLARRGAIELHYVRRVEGEVAVEACLAAPSESATTSRNCHLFVNRRTVRDRGLLQAVVLGYGELIERGRYPTAVVHVDVPAGEVDVNVHPQKLEVRFARPQQVGAVVRHAVTEACARAPWLDGGAREAGAVKVFSLPPERELVLRDGEGFEEQRKRLREALALFGRLPETGTGTGTSASTSASAATGAATGFFGRLRYLGQLQRTYLVCEGEGELVLIDQHAAHERVAFERLRAAHGARAMRTQRLLFPQTVELDDAQAAAASEHAGVLGQLGFEVEAFGGNTLAVKAVPEVLGEAPAGEVIADVLGELGAAETTAPSEGFSSRFGGAGIGEVVAERLERVLATMACHSVVRAGDHLDDARARALLASMDGVDFRAHCPHGRPVLLRMSLGEIERRFGRT